VFESPQGHFLLGRVKQPAPTTTITQQSGNIVPTSTRPTEGDVVVQVIEWFKRYRRLATGIVAVLAVAGASVWFVISARQRKANFAARALQEAQSALAAGNAALAMSDLARLTTTYGGTPAANDGAILLGQLRLSSAQPDSAIRELRQFTQSEPPARYGAAAYHLLGAALEQENKMADAAKAYQQAADMWPYDYLQAQALLDAARAYRAAGDSAQAVAAYQRILHDFSKSPSVTEARVRLAELLEGSPPAS
jgi:outer membrane protein assembly factor BamD (BamD/ComL family)